MLGSGKLHFENPVFSEIVACAQGRDHQLLYGIICCIGISLRPLGRALVNES